MGPRLFSRGNVVRNAGTVYVDASFNGAATFSRGNLLFDSYCDVKRQLQWGRDSSVAEMAAGERDAIRNEAGFNGAATLQSRK